MKLSIREKEIIELISKYSAFNIQALLTESCKHVSKTYMGSDINYHYGNITMFAKIVVLEDRATAYNKIVLLVSLAEKLRKANLLYIISTGNKTKIPLFWINEAGEQTFEKDLTDIFYEYSDKYYVPFIELKEFMVYDYKTQQERKDEKEQQEKEELEERERKYRVEERKISVENQERSFKQTRKIAYISITVSIVVAIITTIINIYTNTNERNVKITNTEPSKVEIINPEVKQILEKNKPDSKNRTEDKNSIKSHLTIK